MGEKRIFHVGLFYFCIFLVFIARLVYIQLIGTESFSAHKVNLIKASIQQRSESFILDNGRGRLLGRDGNPLRKTDRPTLILFPFLKRTSWPTAKIAAIIGCDSSQLKKAVRNAKTPFAFSNELTKAQMEAIRRLQIPGVYAEPVRADLDGPFAEHILGVVAENPQLVRNRYPGKIKAGTVTTHTKIGISGLEEAFDPFLLSRGPSKLVYDTGVNGAPLGLKARYAGSANPFYPLNVRTTLDKEMQQIVQNAVDSAGLVKGGAVLLDARNSNLLAMVSRPLFNANHPFARGAKNYMTLPQAPGSVFKIVTAAAAIEKNTIDADRLYNCDETLYGKPGARRQLGKLDFTQSFAQSCNHTFGETANELIQNDPNYLETYAKKLGLLGPVGWHGSVYHLDALSQFPNEWAGKVWKDDSYKNNTKSVAQTAIGQLNVRVSPLAVANAMATIARGGKKLQVRAATQVEYQNGIKLVSFSGKSLGGGTITPYTAMRMQELLGKVVTLPEGTGQSLSNLPYPVAGKSGTAETGTGKDNHWFAGYFPANNPQYALVVVDLDSSGELKTYRIFKQIVERLYNLNR